MQKMVFVTESLFGIGGTVRVIVNWSNYFADIIGSDVECVASGQGNIYYPLSKKVKVKNIPFKFRFKLLKVFSLFSNTILMYKFLSQYSNANIIFNKSLFIEPIWILRKFGLFKNLNLIYMHHGGSNAFKDFYMKNKFTTHRVKMIFDAFDKTICLFDNEKKYPKDVKLEKLYFILNPLSFAPIDNLEIEKKENIVLSLGRITKAKGIDTLIKAWQNIEGNVKDWQLHIVGDGEDKSEFMKLVEQNNIINIKFIDGTNNVKKFYEQAKIFIIPSVYEGFGLTITEAMSCKCCVISSKTDGGTRLIINNDNGLLFNIGNVEELSSCILKTINDNSFRNKIANNGYDSIEKFKIENLYQSWKHVII